MYESVSNWQRIAHNTLTVSIYFIDQSPYALNHECVWLNNNAQGLICCFVHGARHSKEIRISLFMVYRISFSVCGVSEHR